jgi:alcohol dehydrogenase class IV
VNYHRHFNFQVPTRIEFGLGVSRQLGAIATEMGAKRALLVTDRGILAAGVADLVQDALRNGGLDVTVFSDVQAEPDAQGVVDGVELYRSSRADLIVAVGGGSSLDTGKAISAMVTNPGHIRDYAGLGLLQEPGAPLIAVPTTAGTGSEATIWSVISEKDRGIKYGVGSALMVPRLALCDPELTLTLPPRLTAVTGIDAMSHALESYVNKATQPISEALAERALQLVAASLRTAVLAGDTLTARADMLLASTMAAMAFNPTRLGLAHALAMPLGAHAKIPHGDVVAILMPPVMRYNMTGNLHKFARLAEIFGENTAVLSLREAAEAGVRAVETLIRDVGCPCRLGAYGVQESDLPMLAEEAMTSGNIAVNPRVAGPADLVGIMSACL